MRYAVIGCGRISPNHIAAALENGLEIVALCDIVESAAKEKAERFGLEGVRIYTDYCEMLENEGPELVAICTESGKHGTIALDCLEYGVHLIIEKPIALSLNEADRIIEKSKEKNLKVCACHQNRFNKSIQKLRSAIEQNKFGKLFHGTAHIRWNRGEEYYRQAPWRGTWEQDGGALMNQCIHNIDLLRWMMGGRIVEVVGMTDNLNHDYLEAEDLGMAMVRFENGSYGIIEGTTNVYLQNLEETLYLFGEKGTVKVGGKSVNIIEEWRFADDEEDSEEVKRNFSEDPPNVYGFGHRPLYEDVILAIREDRAPYVTAQDGRDALELVLAIYLSSKNRMSISLPIKHGSTMDFR